MRPKTLLAVTLVVLFWIVLLQNTQVTTFQFLWWRVSLSRIILVPLLVLFGFLLGYFLSKKSGW